MNVLIFHSLIGLALREGLGDVKRKEERNGDGRRNEMVLLLINQKVSPLLPKENLIAKVTKRSLKSNI